MTACAHELDPTLIFKMEEDQSEPCRWWEMEVVCVFGCDHLALCDRCGRAVPINPHDCPHWGGYSNK